MNIVLIIISICLIILIGLISILVELKKITNKHNFASEYLNKFIEFSNSKGKDTTEYDWLILKSEKMQSQLILNFIPDIKSELDKKYIVSTDNFNYIINTVRDCLLRHIGLMEEIRDEKVKEVKNPIIWFREGFKLILILPFLIMNQLSLLNDKRYYKVKQSPITKFIASLITFLGLLSVIMNIALGYEEFINLINKLF